MYYLPKTEELGVLIIIKTFSFYDVPRTFLAFSKSKKQHYLAHWVDESDYDDSWYYVAVNELEIKNLESGFIQIRDFFLYKNVIKINTPFNSEHAYIFELLSIENVDLDLLPPIGYHIVQNEDGEHEVGYDPALADELSSVHEVRIFRENSKKDIEWEPVQKIIGSWNKLYASIMKRMNFDDASLVPLSASLGSYKSKFRASNNKEMLCNSLKLNELLKNKNIQPEELEQLNIDLDIFEELLSSLREFNYKFELRTNTGASIALIDAKSIKSTQERIIEHNQRFISSELIPQANDLTRLMKLVTCVADNSPFNDESEGITPRQINYYKRAAKLLGLLKENGFVLLPLGWKLSMEETYIGKLRIFADAFENSVCGWAWMKYCNVDRIIDVDPDSATEFLINNSSGLSEDTAKRRATSLETWATEFKKLKPLN